SRASRAERGCRHDTARANERGKSRPRWRGGRGERAERVSWWGSLRFQAGVARGDVELHAPVFLAVGFGVVRRDWAVGAEAVRGEAVGCDALVRQILQHGL